MKSKTFAANAEWAEQKLNVTQLQFTDAAGDFAGHLVWDSQTKARRISSAQRDQRQTIRRCFWLRENSRRSQFRFRADDRTFGLDRSFGLARRAGARSVDVELGEFSYKRVPFLSLTSDFSWDGERTMLRDVRLRHAHRRFVGGFSERARRLSVSTSKARSILRRCASLFRGDLQKFSRRMGMAEIAGCAHQSFAALRSTRKPGRATARSRCSARVSAAFGQQRDRAMSMSADGAITFKDLHVSRDEGVGTGAFTYDRSASRSPASITSRRRCGRRRRFIGSIRNCSRSSRPTNFTRRRL